MFNEKISALVGPTYVGAFAFGGLYAATQVPAIKQRKNYRLMASTYLNNVGKVSSKSANNVAAAVFLYLVTGKFINFLFFEELENTSEPMKNAVYGGVTGAVYKSTRGFRPMILGSLLGASIGSAYAYAW
mmetsp:Transcript_78819/g.109204  ORF Transcript_78819/g.109204 Transcript_78819/m.109204 type:complete len:130 (+) Transcript_78819:80-469(+)|eukprot:CAMPEP_0176403784 /NCGR_PEP_ID=MMETSP0126-20121128/50371_1 /TAXON_ID=141414 ORGANISM="Strombidinopsis acuminatum, Strain SPMC142" /NCGR_SAMPLE_ID=MMETSP0126 /ASSEMBLY_ACC=CAM_ASM_000229 /LENGTH=129 /DNA_ID=CAMNT_0017782241 /DNA_START=175 /DNA_END=564 /DNA_ORIENTATION=+